MAEVFVEWGVDFLTGGDEEAEMSTARGEELGVEGELVIVVFDVFEDVDAHEGIPRLAGGDVLCGAFDDVGGRQGLSERGEEFRIGLDGDVTGHFRERAHGLRHLSNAGTDFEELAAQPGAEALGESGAVVGGLLEGGEFKVGVGGGGVGHRVRGDRRRSGMRRKRRRAVDDRVQRGGADDGAGCANGEFHKRVKTIGFVESAVKALAGRRRSFTGLLSGRGGEGRRLLTAVGMSE